MKTALYATVGALLATLAHTALMMFALDDIALIGGSWILAALGQFAAPALLSFAVLCLLRDSGVILPGRAMTALACAAPAWALAAAAAVSWSVGFDEADAQGVTSPLTAAFVPLLGVAWVLGSATVFVLTDTMLRKLPPGARWATACSSVVLTPPLLGVATISPIATAIACLAVLFLCGIKLRPERTAGRITARPVTHTVRRRVAVFSIATLVISIFCVAFALTGATWTPVIDSTRAMQLGLSSGLLCAVFLLFCAEWIFRDRRPPSAAGRGSPITLLALGLGLTALDTVTGFTPSGTLPWPGISLICTGVAIIVFHTLRMAGVVRVVLAAVAGLALLVPMWIVTVTLAFWLPIAALSMMIWSLRGRRLRGTTSLPAVP